MARYQTTVQEPLSIIYGNAILEIQPVGASEAWVNLGVIRDLSVTENITPTQLAGDNADIVKYVSAHTLTISFTQLEIIRGDVLEVLRGTFDDRVDVDGQFFVYTGGRSTLPEFEARLTNVNEENAVTELTAYRCSIDQGFNFAYQSDIAEDPIVTNDLAMTAILDQDRPVGRQLYQVRYQPAPT